MSSSAVKKFSLINNRENSSSLSRASRTAKSILQTAEQQSKQILEQTRQESIAIKNKAHAEGYDDGIKHALEQALDSEKYRKELLGKAKEETLELVFIILEQLLGENPEMIRQSLTSRIQKALDHCLLTNSPKVFVHPSDRELIETKLKAELQSTNHSPIEVHGDETLTPGNACLETEASVIELNIERHFRAIKRQLKKLSTEN